MSLSKKGELKCAYQDCTATVSEDDHCAGCDYYVCELHDENAPWGKHDVVEHWDTNDE